MDKRLPLALAICLLILLGWNVLFPGPPRTAPKPNDPPAPVSAAEPAPAPAPAAPLPDPKGAVIAGVEEPDLVLHVGERGKIGSYLATFSNRGGALVELRTGMWFDRVGLTSQEKLDPEHWTRLLVPIDTGAGTTGSLELRTSPSSEHLVRGPLERALWSRRLLGPAEAPEGVEFTLAQGSGITFRKRYLFKPGEDVLRFEIEIENTAMEGGVDACEFVLTPGACMPAEGNDKWTREPQAIAYSRGKGESTGTAEVAIPDERGSKLAGPLSSQGGTVSFLGVFNKYFAVLLHGTDDGSRSTLLDATWRGLRDEHWARSHPENAASAWKQIVADARVRFVLPSKGESRTFRYELYAGPKERNRLEAAWSDHAALIHKDLGFFNGIASTLLAVLGFFQKLTGNWGVAIILLTISVRALLFPLNRRMQTAMARYQSKMKRLQPRIDDIKKRHAKDPAAQRQEQTKLMQEEGAFPPLLGCLPMFLQIPVFIGLFAALRSSFDLRQAPFGLWIHDLAVPDRLLHIGLKLPLLGPIEYLNILPLLMVVLWIWQQKGMPVPADEQAARMQKMMMWMPVMMGFFLYNYAAGLSLYMITQSGLGIVEQKVIKKFWPLDDKERPKKKNGFMARLMEAQQQQMKSRERQQRAKARR